jgi:hypothetical protein
MAIVHKSQKAFRAVILNAQLTPRLACAPPAPQDNHPLGLDDMPTPMLAASQHPARLIEERNEQEG